MNKLDNSPETLDGDRTPEAELSAEERQVLARIEKQAKPRRRKPWWRPVADTTLHYWFWHW